MVKKKKKKVVTGFMCKIEWDYNIGKAASGVTIYPTLETLRRYHGSIEECGIVEVEVSIKEIVEESKV
jgi:hypothetical protein